VRFGGSDVTLSTDPVSNKELWQIRKEALWSSMAAYPEKDIMITDVCVPLSNFPTIIEDLKKRIKTSMLPCPMVAHAGDGNIHVFIMFDSKDPVEHQEADDLHDFMVYKALELEGTCTGEHGIGYGKIRYLNTEYTSATLKMMSDIKVCLDPKNILNPGKVIGPEYIRASQESRSCNKCTTHTNKTFCG
jgi:D-lactate dehydrogenase (cytochrome)